MKVAVQRSRRPLGRVHALALLLALCSCVVRHGGGPPTTGTCGGACAHYLDCKGDRDGAAHDACVAECGQVFASDEVSLREFERLSCEKTIEFVDGKRIARQL